MTTGVTSPQTLINGAELARLRLAKAESSLAHAKEESRAAKRRRKEAKRLVRRARKEVKLAKAEVSEARRALDEAEMKLEDARESYSKPTPSHKKRKTSKVATQAGLSSREDHKTANRAHGPRRLGRKTKSGGAGLDGYADGISKARSRAPILTSSQPTQVPLPVSPAS